MESTNFTLEMVLEALNDLGAFRSVGLDICEVLDGCRNRTEKQSYTSPSRTSMLSISYLVFLSLNWGIKLGNQGAEVVDLVQPLERV